MKHTKKAQAALEFLMTYGWAILVVLVAIGALAYFGVLSPDRFLPNKCAMQPGLGCTDFKVTPTTVDVVLQNGLGSDISITEVRVDDCTALTPAATVANGNEYTVAFSGCTITGSKYDTVVNVSFQNLDSGLNKTNIGTLTSKVE